MSDVKELLAPELHQKKAKRKSAATKAARQGMTLVFSGFVVILILAILRDFFPVPKSLFAIAVLIFIIGGAIRMAMPSLFGNHISTDGTDDWREADLETNKLTGGKFPQKFLPEAEYRPPINFGAKIYDTNELLAPASVTEDTTRPLEKEFQPK